MVTFDPDTVDGWAHAYVLDATLSGKLAPPAPPARWQEPGRVVRLPAPGRPPELRRVGRAGRTPKPSALVDRRQRARLLHTFWHHELQAAELMCWALLAFADAEHEFRKGLLRVCLDEIRHMNMYRAHIERLGFALGAFEVRDWFWERVPSVTSKLSFVALMGMGLEAANLEHAPRFAEQFRAAGDAAGAELQDRIANDEIAHVRFATRWFTRWTGGCSFEEWRRALPAPLSPLLMRGAPIDDRARRAAGMPEDFVRALSSWSPEAEPCRSPGS